MEPIERHDTGHTRAMAPAMTLGDLPKTPTGIVGLDEITGGGLPSGRPTLVCGPAGCGKTLLGVEFLYRGIVEFDEPGVLIAFEETADDLIANVASIGFDLAGAEAEGKLVIDHVQVIRGEIEEAGDWDLDGLFLRLGAAIDTVGAKRVVIDTIETLFGVFSDTAILRSELRRLFGWLKERGVTAVITAERGDGTLTRHGIEEYVSDCVIVLDHRVNEQASTRRIRILKYRGSHHATNEYPFLISPTGISVRPLTSDNQQQLASSERVSTGLARLDAMFGGDGFYKGSTVLINGTTGSGKSTMAAQFCAAACRRGERSVYVARQESEAELLRNMRSVGIDLKPWIDAGVLQVHCVRRLLDLEAHLFAVERIVTEFDPSVVVIDPISDVLHSSAGDIVSEMLLREVNFLKRHGVTTMLTSLSTDPDGSLSEHLIEAFADTRIVIKAVHGNGEINRIMYVIKSRGMDHSNQIREFLITDNGIELSDVYVGPQGILTGSARQSQEAQEHFDGIARLEDLEQRRVKLERRRESVEAQTASIWRDFQDEATAVGRLLTDASLAANDREHQRTEQGRLRRVDSDKSGDSPQKATPLEVGTA